MTAFFQLVQGVTGAATIEQQIASVTRWVETFPEGSEDARWRGYLTWRFWNTEGAGRAIVKLGIIEPERRFIAGYADGSMYYADLGDKEWNIRHSNVPDAGGFSFGDPSALGRNLPTLAAGLVASVVTQNPLPYAGALVKVDTSEAARAQEEADKVSAQLAATLAASDATAEASTTSGPLGALHMDRSTILPLAGAAALALVNPLAGAALAGVVLTRPKSPVKRTRGTTSAAGVQVTTPPVNTEVPPDASEDEDEIATSHETVGAGATTGQGATEPGVSTMPTPTYGRTDSLAPVAIAPPASSLPAQTTVGSSTPTATPTAPARGVVVGPLVINRTSRFPTRAIE